MTIVESTAAQQDKSLKSTVEIRHPRVCVIIPVFNAADQLQDCLAALNRQCYPRGLLEIIVVDNGSTDGCRAVVDSFAGVRYCVQNQTGSYAARNLGIEATDSDILAFTDADCVPSPDWLTRAVEELLSTPQVFVLAGTVDLTPLQAGRISFVERHQLAYSLNQHRCVSLGYGTTANLIVRREAFTVAGTFCPDLLSMGDYEWGRRASAAGFRPRLASNVQVRHAMRQQFRQLVRRNRRLAGGEFRIHHQLNRMSIPQTLWKISCGLFRPRKFARPESVCSWRHWLGVSVMELSLRGVRLGEALRLALGGHAIRD